MEHKQTWKKRVWVRSLKKYTAQRAKLYIFSTMSELLAAVFTCGTEESEFLSEQEPTPAASSQSSCCDT